MLAFSPMVGEIYPCMQKYVYRLLYHTYVHVICNSGIVHPSIFFIEITKFPNKKAVLYDFFSLTIPITQHQPYATMAMPMCRMPHRKWRQTKQQPSRVK